MKNIIIGLSLFIILLSSIACENAEKGKDELDTFFKEKGFDKSDELTREQFIDLTDYLLTKTTDKVESEKIGFRQFIPKHVQHVPETFKKDDINKYVKTETLSAIMHDFIDAKYPGKQGDEMKEQLRMMSEAQGKMNKKKEEI